LQAQSVVEFMKFDGGKAHMRALLSQITEDGFAPLKDMNDREAEVISRHNVGVMVLHKSATVIGLPDDA
jgi:hypothetical protein